MVYKEREQKLYTNDGVFIKDIHCPFKEKEIQRNTHDTLVGMFRLPKINTLCRLSLSSSHCMPRWDLFGYGSWDKYKVSKIIW